MTYPSLIMWSGSSKIHSFIDFWQPLCGGCGEQGCLFQPNWRTIGQISTTQDLKKFNILVDPEFKNPGHTRSSRYAFEHPVMNIEYWNQIFWVKKSLKYHASKNVPDKLLQKEKRTLNDPFSRLQGYVLQERNHFSWLWQSLCDGRNLPSHWIFES